MKQHQIYKLYVSFLLVFSIFIVHGPHHSALAIGPGTGGSKIRVSDEKIGPYVLLVATSPLPVTVGQMSVWVRIRDGKTDQLRREAVVRVEATPREGGPTLTAQATHKNAGNDFDYVAHFDVAETGQWDVTVFVEDEPGQAEVSFTESVTRGLSSKLLVGLAIPFVILAVIVGVYLWRRAKM